MEMYPRYKSPLGYMSGDNRIDSYGVNHSGFTTRDELEYQVARQKRENQLIQNYNRQGITGNYPQYGTNFWGNPENNYGFGDSNIQKNIENMQDQTPTPWAQSNTGWENNDLARPDKPVYVNPHPKGFSTGDILWEGVKGFGQGVLGGIEHGINTATMGGYDMVSDILENGGYERRQKELEKLADDVNLGKAYKYANYAIDIAADGLAGKGLSKIKRHPVVKNLSKMIK